MKENLKRLNWKLILLHFVATWLFIHSFYILSYLHDIEFTEFIMKNKNETPVFEEIPFDTKRMSNFFMITGVSKFIGLLVAFIISLSISIYKKWFCATLIIILGKLPRNTKDLHFSWKKGRIFKDCVSVAQ